MKRAYFVGIGGIGMSGLARYFKAKGWLVSGSDLAESRTTGALRKEGIRITIGHRRNHVNRAVNLLVYNRAIPKNNPELRAVRKLGIRAIPYAEALGMLTRAYETIAITGSHGKSTTTALAALILIKGGLDPTVLIGTNLKEFGGKNIRIGKGRRLVLEADDFGGAFLDYSPAIAIVTNIDKEHIDFYGSFAQLKGAFLKFLANTKPGGTLILNRDDKPLVSLKPRIKAIANQKPLRVMWYSLRDPSTKAIKTILKISGAHNLSNAAAAYELGKLLKIPEATIRSALGCYRGSWRRMEYRGALRGRAKIFDDYAHHPTEIRATLQGFRERFPRSPIVCVFQPHQAKRLARLFKDFARAFDAADAIVFLPLYKVPGRDEKIVKRRNSKALALAIQKRSPQKPVRYLSNPALLKKTIAQIVRPRSILIMMGAGDIVELTASLLS